jgi:anti-sigma factor RsiW
MNCSEVSTLTPLWLAKELDPGHTRDFALHVASCAACRENLAQLQACDEQLRAGIRAESLDTASIDGHVRAAMRVPGSVRPWLPAAALIAAALLLAIAGWQALLTAHMTKTLAAAARDHRIEIVDRQPRKWITDPASLQSLVRKQGFESSAVAAYAPAGYHLSQGRLCFLNGQIFLHLVYATDAGNFSLFLRRPGKTPLTSVSDTARAGDFAREHTAGFQKHYLTAVVVTEETGDIARRLADSVAAAL